MTQLNTPYPATAYLTGFLRSKAYSCAQADPAIELVLRMFSRQGLNRIAGVIRARVSSNAKRGASRKKNPFTEFFLENFDRYDSAIEAAIRFLQAKDPSLALRIVSREFLPEGPRFDALNQFEGENLSWAFGSLGIQDRAKYLASLMIDDLADLIRVEIDPRFELSRYGEKLAESAPTFDPLLNALHAKPTLVDEILDEITLEVNSEASTFRVGADGTFSRECLWSISDRA